MGDDSCGKSERVADLMKIVAELNHERYFTSEPNQKPSVWRQRVEGAEEAQSVYEVAAEGIDRDHALGFELAERNLNRPLVRRSGAQTVVGEIGALADVSRPE